MMAGAGRGTQRWVVAMTLLAVPSALLFEMEIASWNLPPAMGELRATLGPVLKPLSWVLFALTFVSGGIGLALQSVIRRRLAQAEERKGTTQTTAGLGAFIITASLVQLPAILAGLMYVLGGPLKTAILSGGVATVVVAVQALLLERGRSER